ncbi:helix-turn-helix domain-containing protein [Azospirillum sp. TSH64]|uniref:helix-turn-helix domain-containing protein n=1 Tax=Azospirillum sp. TSH64 TaxID=652740 RepID=UPI000D620C98|nr:helix-turn-helix domain-containing protein [Azospirillum sp. TSH64]PWC74185.1 transcriptional regulator [Azospirillum sp. TSH64]
MSVANDDYAPSGEDAIPAILGRHLRRLRTRQGLSLERLARLSGVSRAMLGQIELGRSAPTITVLWKIARALDVTLASLTRFTEQGGVVVVRQSQTRTLVSADGLAQSRLLAPPGEGRGADVFEIRLHPSGSEVGGGHPPGTGAHLVVAEGMVELRAAGALHRLAAGDTILFDADVPYACVNVGDGESLLFLVLSHTEILP